MEITEIKTKLSLSTDDFERSVRKMRREIQEFEQRFNIGKGVLMKFAGGIGIATTAYEAFNKIIHSSQTLSDAYTECIDGMKGSVDNLVYSISNADFTPFLLGLGNSIELAREATAAMDQLGNTAMSYGYFSNRNQAGLQEQIAILRDKNTTEDIKQVAKAEADRILKDQKEITEQLSKRSQEAMTALVQKSTGLKNLDVSQMDIEKALRLDVSSIGDEEKRRLSSLYEEFKRKSNELHKQYTYSQQTGSSNYGAIWTEVTDYNKLSEALKPLLATYQDAIIYNSTLVKESDEWLQNLINIGTSAYQAERSYASMVKSVNKATQSGSETITGKSGKPVNQDIVSPLEGSVSYLKQEIASLQKQFEAATEDGVRRGLQQAIEIAQRDLDRMIFASQIKTIEAGRLGQSGQIGRSASADIGKMEIKPIVNKESIRLTDQYNEGLNQTLSMMLAISNATNKGASSWITYGVNTVTSLNNTYQALAKVIPALQVEALYAGAASAAQIPVVGWITAIAAIGALTAAFASIPRYETGGIVGGSSYVGDKTLIRANAGELILNKAQQKNIASQLSTADTPSRVDVYVTGRIDGRDIKLVMDRRNHIENRVS